MLSVQEKKEKADFFRRLDSLGNSDTDDGGADLSVLVVATKKISQGSKAKETKVYPAPSAKVVDVDKRKERTPASTVEIADAEKPNRRVSSSSSGVIEVEKPRRRPVSPTIEPADGQKPKRRRHDESVEVAETERPNSWKRNPSEEAPQPKQRSAKHPPSLTRTSSLPRPKSKHLATTKPSLSRAATIPGGSTKSKAPQPEVDFTNLSNFDDRLNGMGKPKLRPLPKGKLSKLADFPIEKQIFRGLVFCKHTRRLDHILTSNISTRLCAKQ